MRFTSALRWLTGFAALNVAPVIQNRQATAQFLKAEGARFAAVIKARGIKLD